GPRPQQRADAERPGLHRAEPRPSARAVTLTVAAPLSNILTGPKTRLIELTCSLPPSTPTRLRSRSFIRDSEGGARRRAVVERSVVAGGRPSVSDPCTRAPPPSPKPRARPPPVGRRSVCRSSQTERLDPDAQTAMVPRRPLLQHPFDPAVRGAGHAPAVGAD